MTVPHFVIQRQPSTEKGTRGEWLDSDGSHLCYTIERPWLDNQQQVSCIPPGIYTCVRYSSMRFPNVWEVTDVPNRSAILIHAGNTMNDLRGCIAPGSAFADFDGFPAVINSRPTLDRLRKTLPAKFTLEIRA